MVFRLVLATDDAHRWHNVDVALDVFENSGISIGCRRRTLANVFEVLMVAIIEDATDNGRFCV